MLMEVLDDADSVALHAAAIIASEARQAVAERGRFILAVSGGTTPWKMLRAFARQDVPWEGVRIVQVDERQAPEGHRDRNLTHLRQSLLEFAPLRPGRIHAMPVEEKDLSRAAASYGMLLRSIAGSPVILDLVHLGLGADGHTASLVPGDPVLEECNSDVGATGVYQGRRRLTLTYPILNRAGRVLWLVTGTEKAAMLARLCAADPSIPAGRVNQDRATVLADRGAAGEDA